MKRTRVIKPYSVDNERIGNIIKDARINMSMTQEQLAEAVNITPAFIGHIERGNKSLSLTTLVGIANTLHIDIECFFMEDELTPNQKVIQDFKQLICDKPYKTKEAILDIIRTALKHLD